MRGERTFISKQKVDIVLSEARYSPDGQQAQLLRGYVRRGVVWGDWQLFKRQEILDKIEAGKKIFTGKPGAIAGDFELIAPVSAMRSNGTVFLRAEGISGAGDVLDLPDF